MNKTLLVIKETYLRAVKSLAFIAMLIGPLLPFAIGLFISYTTSKTADNVVKDQIAIVAPPVIQKSFQEYKPLGAKSFSSVNQAKKAYQKGDVAGYMTVDNNNGQLVAKYRSDNNLSIRKSRMILGILNGVQKQYNLVQAKVTPAQAEQLSKKARFVQQKIGNKGNNKDEIGQVVALYFLTFVLYFLVITYTTTMANAVAAEKGSKIMEIIFSSISASKYFVGKVIGILLEMLTQIVVYVIAFWGAWHVFSHLAAFKDLFTIMNPLVKQVFSSLGLWAPAFVVVDLILFIIYAAFSGVLVTKAEDSGKASQVLVYIVVIGLISNFTLFNTPHSLILTVLSYVPFLSSFAMPLRLVAGTATNIEAAISFGILVVFTVGSFIFIKNIYPKLVLQTDDIGIFKNLHRALKANR